MFSLLSRNQAGRPPFCSPEEGACEHRTRGGSKSRQAAEEEGGGHDSDQEQRRCARRQPGGRCGRLPGRAALPPGGGLLGRGGAAGGGRRQLSCRGGHSSLRRLGEALQRALQLLARFRRVGAACCRYIRGPAKWGRQLHELRSFKNHDFVVLLPPQPGLSPPAAARHWALGRRPAKRLLRSRDVHHVSKERPPPWSRAC